VPYIKKIELKGFKSFGPENVKLRLDRGFTAVTGPNGSGKTNIVDAVLFALGELSTRRLRAENSAKLIYSGFERAKKAKVIIQFDNKDGRLPVDTNTVTISREVFKNGQSVYRLNGRRTSRTYILENLSIAGISFTSQNIILQGTVTRLTEVSSIERRKIIEDLVGIAQYDNERAEAREKLGIADLSIRTAMGRIEEVQKRVDDLERERNDVLRYNFIQNEMKKLDAIKLSHDIRILQEKTEKNSLQSEKVRKKVERIKKIREERRSKRKEIEKEWRKLSSEIVDGEGSQVLNVQMKLGEVKSKLTELTTIINSGKTSIEGLNRIKENNLQQYQTIQKEIRENRLKRRRLERDIRQILEEISKKQREHDKFVEDTTFFWENLGGNNQKIRLIEKKLDEKYKKRVYLRAQQTKGQTTIKNCIRKIRELENRRERFSSTLNDLENSLKELEKVKQKQKSQMNNFEQMLERRDVQRKSIKNEIAEAGKIAKSAREAVIEFETQRDIAETVAAEERALKSIEELGELGVIQKVYGRFRNLVKIERSHRQAIDVASAGWLDAIIVEDFDAAFACTEALRRMKLGRIKIIPLRGISNLKSLKLPKNRNVKRASLSIKCAKKYEPAVQFVFGDTLLVSDNKNAFALSSEGYRTVTINGDLYEAGGALESGYYRAPINFSTIVPSDEAIESLDEAVNALQEYLKKRSDDVTSFDEEVERTRVEIAHLSEAMNTLEGELFRLKRNIKRTKTNIKRLNRNIVKLEKEREKEKKEIWLRKSEINSINKERKKLQYNLVKLKQKIDLADIQEMETKKEKLAEEIIIIRQKLGSFQTENLTLQSQFNNVLEVGYKNSKIQLTKVKQQLRRVEREVNSALKEREIQRKELSQLEKKRLELSKTVFSAKENAKKFTVQIDGIDKQLQRIDSEYEEADRLFSELEINSQTFIMQLEQYRKQLKQVGYEKPLEVTIKHVEEAETSMKMMRFEIERIGAINQLAVSHYTEQISRYKELSLRMNELEKEKRAIIQFMEEIEQKKRNTFMKAFEKINQNLSKYFFSLTGGGKATLKLENLEEPFSGGVDMIVQFPEKPSIVVSGASGGERSVAAVAFIFSLKDFTPASFYILDEVDAHLDAFHVSKLADLLLKEAEDIQFIVVTLKPEMVNKAQKVYGVYENNGVSNVISVNLLEVPS
jgi:chromosome segregation protein